MLALLKVYSNKVTLATVLTVGGEQEVGGVLLRKPFDLVDLLLDLQALQVVKLWLVALECAVNIVLPSPLGLALALRGEWKAQTDSEALQCLSYKVQRHFPAAYIAILASN